MFSVRRWWSQYGLHIIVTMLLLTVAAVIWHTQAVPIYELYYWLQRPFAATQARQKTALTNAKIEELQQRVEELQQQNQQLKTLLDYTQTRSKPLKTAPIIGRSADHWWQQITLGIGSNQGVQSGDIVTGIGGLVGRVKRVTPHTSLVLLISDPHVRVGVMISRTRNMGFIRGQANNQVLMEFFEKLPNVKVGDSVVTSPASRLFPPGIPVGKVTEIDLQESPAPQATIDLNVPMDDLEWVFVQSYQVPEE